ncbi:MAG: hypothetical protein ACJ8CR_08105 [Roseiflexaceae bacterium]
MRLVRLVLPFALIAVALAGCGGGALLADVALSAPTLQPTGNGEHVDISYQVGRPAKVTIYLQDAAGARYTLRDGEPREPSPEPYLLRLDGTAPTDDPVLRRRALPSGDYTLVVEATGADGGQAREQRPISIQGADAPPPLIQNLVVRPAIISPNADGLDDIAEITYGLPVSATVSIDISGPGCAPTPCPFITADEEPPALQRHTWNGRTVDNVLLPDGVYTYTVRAADRYGNLVEQSGAITIAGGGQPEVAILNSYMAPQALMRGEVLTVTMRVKNTGKVPIRTYGPPSGYEYSTDEVFSSIAGGQYTVKPGGFWRIGVDWDANSGGAAKRYPYRWAITPRPPEQWKVPGVEDELLPGEEAEVVGRIRVVQPETKMGFYVGLIQDGVGFFQDRTGRTIVNVGF